MNLAYTQSCLWDEDNKISIVNSGIQADSIPGTKWRGSYVYPLKQELNSGLAIKNTVPRASAAVMRKSAACSVRTELVNYKEAGDWFFYLELLKDGRIAYSSKALNSYRGRDSDAIHPTDGKAVQEIENIHRYILENYEINNDTIDCMKSALSADYNYTKAKFQLTLDYDSFKQIYYKFPTILISIDGLTYGGAEIFPIRLANELASRGYKVYLLSFDCAKANADVIEMINPKVLLVRMADVYAQGGLRQFVIDKKIDYISTHSYDAEKVIVRNIGDLPVFWSITTHGHYDHLVSFPQDDIAFPDLFPVIFKRADHIFYTADKNLQSLKKLPFDIQPKSSKINNGFSKPHGGAIDRASYNIKKEDIVFVLAARGVPEKGWKEAITAVIKLNNENNNNHRAYHIFMIGDSSYVRSLQNEYRFPYIHFVGFQSELAPFIAASDIGLVPTYYISESQPLIIIEFLASNKPCVASDIGEISQMLLNGNHKAGELVQYNGGPINVEELVRAIKKIIKDQETYNKYAEDTKELFKQYDMTLCADRYLELINQNK